MPFSSNADSACRRAFVAASRCWEKLAVMLTLLMSLLQAQPAAAQTCVLSGFSSTPTLPTTLYVRNNYSVNDRVFSAAVRTNFTCTGTANQAFLILPPNDEGVASPIVGSNMRYVFGAGTPVNNDLSRVTITSGPCTAKFKSFTSPNTSRSAFVVFNSGGTCTGTFTTGIAFIATAANPSGVIPKDLPTNFPSAFSTGGWLAYLNCTNATCQFGSLPASMSSSGPGYNVTLVPMTTSCSLSSSSLTVTLPTVSKNSLSGVGTTAGRAAINLSVVCPSGVPATGVSMAMTFLPVISPVTGLQLSDVVSTTGTATGVGIRFYDKNSNPIASSTPVSISTTTAAGAYPIGLSASYVATNSTVGAGNLTATATIMLQYH